MAWQTIAEMAGNTGTVTLRGDAVPTGNTWVDEFDVTHDHVSYSGFLRVIVSADFEGRAIIRIRRPNATSGRREILFQVDADETDGQLRFRIPLLALTLTNDPADPDNAFRVRMSYMSEARTLQVTTIRQQVREILEQIRVRLGDFPNPRRLDLDTWQTIGDEIVPDFGGRMVGGEDDV